MNLLIALNIQPGTGEIIMKRKFPNEPQPRRGVLFLSASMHSVSFRTVRQNEINPERVTLLYNENFPTNLNPEGV